MDKITKHEKLLREYSDPDVKVNARVNVNVNVRIMLICVVCGGFGDVIFASKIWKFLKEFKNVEATIATNNIEAFIGLGTPKEALVRIKIKNSSKGFSCKAGIYSNIILDSDTDTDLVFVTPVTSGTGMSGIYEDISSLFSNKHVYDRYNIYLFSEYNDILSKIDFDFPTGIGNGKCGILINNSDIGERLDWTPHPYILMYISYTTSIPDPSSYVQCLHNFITMICRKYDYNRLDIFIPQKIYFMFGHYLTKICENVNLEIFSIQKDKSLKLHVFPSKVNSGKSIRLVPLKAIKYESMQRLIKHSLKDILVTGDQSLSDVLSCCTDKIIWYQYFPWKRDLISNISEYIPSIKFSCGYIEYDKLDMADMNKFDLLIKWDLKTNIKKKLDSILRVTRLYKSGDDYVKEYIDSDRSRVEESQIVGIIGDGSNGIIETIIMNGNTVTSSIVIAVSNLEDLKKGLYFFKDLMSHMKSLAGSEWDEEIYRDICLKCTQKTKKSLKKINDLVSKGELYFRNRLGNLALN